MLNLASSARLHCITRCCKAPSTRTHVNIFTCEYFHGFKNYLVHTLPFSYSFCLSTRTRVNLKTITKYIKRMRRRRHEPAKTCSNHGFLFNNLYFLQLQTRINTWCEKIGRNFVYTLSGRYEYAKFGRVII